MFIGAMLPATLVAWRPHSGMRQMNGQTGYRSALFSRAVSPDADMPPGLVAVAPETRSLVAEVSDFARSRFVELQTAVEPHLIARADAAAYRACLRHLIIGAIGRASSGVLVTARQRADGVEIAVLDDGTAASGMRPDRLPRAAAEPAVPEGATLAATYLPDQGTTMLLRLPPGSSLPPDGDESDEITSFTTF